MHLLPFALGWRRNRKLSGAGLPFSRGGPLRTMWTTIASYSRGYNPGRSAGATLSIALVAGTWEIRTHEFRW